MDGGERRARSNVMNAMTCLGVANPKFFVFRSFVESEEEQSHLVKEALSCHAQNEGSSEDVTNYIQSSSSSKNSFKLNLGILCGGDLTNILPKSVNVARQALSMTLLHTTDEASKSLKLIAKGPLSGLSLLYCVGASMPSHYDSPTQPGQREEWLVMITLGNSIEFRCDSEVLILESGDALVMDSMAVLHGVERILPDTIENPICSRIGLSNLQARLGILFWQGKETSKLDSMKAANGIAIDDFCVDGLFDD